VQTIELVSIVVDKLLDVYNAKASIYVHEDQLCIYVNDEHVAEKAYDLVNRSLCDIISISEF